MASSSSSKKTTPTPEISTVSGWKGRKISSGIELTLPSGNVALVRPVSVAEMIAENMLPDSLLSTVQGHIEKGSGKVPADFKKKKTSAQEAEAVIQDPKKLMEMFDGVDRLVAKIVLEPPVRYHRIQADDGTGISAWRSLTTEERAAQGEVLWTDEVDLDDKFFIFQWVAGGTADLEQFRAESGEALDGVRAS